MHRNDETLFGQKIRLLMRPKEIYISFVPMEITWTSPLKLNITPGSCYTLYLPVLYLYSNQNVLQRICRAFCYFFPVHSSPFTSLVVFPVCPPGVLCLSPFRGFSSIKRKMEEWRLHGGYLSVSMMWDVPLSAAQLIFLMRPIHCI